MAVPAVTVVPPVVTVVIAGAPGARRRRGWAARPRAWRRSPVPAGSGPRQRAGPLTRPRTTPSTKPGRRPADDDLACTRRPWFNDARAAVARAASPEDSESGRGGSRWPHTGQVPPHSPRSDSHGRAVATARAAACPTGASDVPGDAPASTGGSVALRRSAQTLGRSYPRGRMALAGTRRLARSPDGAGPPSADGAGFQFRPP